MAPRPRRSSPTASEPDLDISAALADTGFLSDNDDLDDSISFSGPRVVKKPKLGELNPEDDIFKGIEGGDDEGSDDEEEFIAARQAAFNRKAIAVKGKGVKSKGGGFQAMGMCRSGVLPDNFVVARLLGRALC